MGFAKKRHLVQALNPDIAILPETSQRDIEETQAPFKAWVGSNPHKGLGIVGFTNRSYTLHEACTLLPWHIPFSVDGPNVIGLWSHVRDKDLKYVRVTHEVIDRHAGFLSSAPSLIIGDFNSNTVWDREHPGRNHSMLVKKLEALGLQSVYHKSQGLAPRRGDHKDLLSHEETALRPSHRLRIPWRKTSIDSDRPAGGLADVQRPHATNPRH